MITTTLQVLVPWWVLEQQSHDQGKAVENGWTPLCGFLRFVGGVDGGYGGIVS